MRETLPLGGHHLYDRIVARTVARFYGTQAHRFDGAKWVLDIGCGPGRLVRIIKETHPDAEVVGADMDPAQVRIARRWQSDVDATFMEAPSHDLPFPDDHFDVVVSSESFHHWRDQEGGLAELHRVTRPGGRIMVWETCGDITKQELGSWTGWVPPLWIHVVRRIFTEHGYTTEALPDGLVAPMEAEFGACRTERVDGWWIVTATAGPEPTRQVARPG